MSNPSKNHIQNNEIHFINDSVKELCLSHGQLIELKKNTIIFSEEYYYDKPYVYYIVHGICAVCGFSIDGQEQTFVYQIAGEMTGHVPYMIPADAHAPLYSYQRPTILTKTNCILYKIPQAEYIRHMENNLEFSNYLNRLLARSYSMSLAHLKQVQEDSVVTVICRFLLQMSFATPAGPVLPKLFTYNEIATYFGIHEVTVSRIIGRLKSEGYLSRTPNGLLINDSEKLRDIILHPEEFKYKNN